jgi:hypothetical protein
MVSGVGRVNRPWISSIAAWKRFFPGQNPPGVTPAAGVAPGGLRGVRGESPRFSGENLRLRSVRVGAGGLPPAPPATDRP